MSRRVPRIAVAALAASAFAAHAGPVYPNTPRPRIEIEQRLGAELPFDAAFVADDGRHVRLGDYFSPVATGATPVVLVLGYYHCPRLCETVLESALEGLAESGAAHADYRVVAVSIDPAETPADARSRRATALAFADLAAQRVFPARTTRDPSAVELHALVGDEAAIERLARSVGFGYRRRSDLSTTRDEAAAAFDHAAGFIVVTPGGHVSRYFLGLRPNAATLHTALDDARGERIGSWVDRLVLLCAHIDPTLGRWSGAVLVTLRVVGVASGLALALWIVRRRRIEHREARP